VVTSSVPQAPAAHPQEAIGDDFIARALQDAQAPADDAGSRADAHDGPDGRMSLGRFGD